MSKIKRSKQKNTFKLVSCVKGYWGYTVATPLLVIGEVLLEVLIPMAMAWLINEIYAMDPTAVGESTMPGFVSDMLTAIAGSRPVPRIITLGASVVVMGVISLFFGAYAGHTASVASVGFATNLRMAQFSRIQAFGFSNVDKFSTSSLITRMTTDVTNIQNAFQMMIRMMIRAPIMMIFSLIMSIVLNARLSLVFLAVVPVLGVGLAIMMTRAHPYFTQLFKKYDKLNSVVQENLIGVRVVKSFVREEHEIEKFERASKDVLDFSKKAEKVLLWSQPLMQICMYACMVCIAWFGGRQIVYGSMQTGDLTAFMTYVMQILMSLMMVAMVFVTLVMSRASAQRIREVLNEQSDIVDPPDPVTEVADGSVEFDDVSFRYARHTEGSGEAGEDVLQHINLRFGSGETIGIIGGTGSSKSSLVQLIPRLYDATEGVVRVGGRDVREYSLVTLRDSVAMVLQKNVLFSGTIEENLRWGNPDATQEELEEACRHAQAHDFVMSFPNGYKTDLGQGGVNVSGGQKQRLCIARALLKHPKIIILDDSTSAVDTKTDALIRKSLTEDLSHITKIIIAQRIASVQDADHIIVMNDGKVAAFGTHDELMRTSEIYREVYLSQTKGSDVPAGADAGSATTSAAGKGGDGNA